MNIHDNDGDKKALLPYYYRKINIKIFFLCSTFFFIDYFIVDKVNKEENRKFTPIKDHKLK